MVRPLGARSTWASLVVPGICSGTFIESRLDTARPELPVPALGSSNAFCINGNRLENDGL